MTLFIKAGMCGTTFCRYFAHVLYKCAPVAAIYYVFLNTLSLFLMCIYYYTFH